MQSQADKASVFTDAEIREVLLKQIKKLEIPVDSPDDLKINRFGNRIVIELKYQEVLYLTLGEEYDWDLHVFEFNPRVEQDITGR